MKLRIWREGERREGRGGRGEERGGGIERRWERERGKKKRVGREGKGGRYQIVQYFKGGSKVCPTVKEEE